MQLLLYEYVMVLKNFMTLDVIKLMRKCCEDENVKKNCKRKEKVNRKDE